MGAIKEGNIQAEFPKKLRFLFEPARYKVLYGGRGGAKSWGVARALLLEGVQKPLRILCAREFQNSIKESVHHLLESQIEALGLQSFYQIQKAAITGVNGTEFFFTGLHNNTSGIKSFEAVDRAWVEEAQSVSQQSWKDLVPTIRKDGSEIWLTFNPELESDETYQRFVVDPPSDAVVCKVNWQDNPFFNAVLERERLDDLRRDPEAYRNIWEGECLSTLAGAIYAKEVRQAEEDGRIRTVPYDALKPVHTFWDLGWADNTSIWFAQSVGPELRLIDYYSNSLQPLSHYLQLLQGKGYIYGIDWLPHDAKAKSLATGRSIEESMLALGRKVSITPNLSVFDGINAARTIFNRCYFDKDKCSDGLRALRHYRYDIDPQSKQLSGRPLHDWACFVAGTQVETVQGLKPIESLTTTDKVFTPNGPRSVVGVYQYTATELIEITTADGRTVTCTPEHKFFTPTGLIAADALCYGCNLYTGKEISWRLISLILKAIGTTGLNEAISSLILHGNKPEKALNPANFIGSFGKASMGLFQKAMKYITKTETPATMRLKTLNAYPSMNTGFSMGQIAGDAPHLGTSQKMESGFIPKCQSSSGLKTANQCLNHPGNQSKLLVKPLKSGTEARKGWNGTKNTERKRGKQEKLSIKFAKFAVNRLLRFGLEPNSAGTIVGLRRLEGVNQPVYDLTVEHDHCYVANGILTSNSHGADAFRYFALSIADDAPAVSARGIKIPGWRA